MRILFVRHGESEANLLHEFSNRGWKHPLTDKGRLQVEILAGRLATYRVSRILTSPLMRAVQSAEILAEKLGAPVEQSDALREYDAGEWEGKSDPAGWEEYRAVNEAWMLRGEYEQRMHGGESFVEVYSRFSGLLGELIHRYGESAETLLLVGHGGLYRIMLAQVLINVSVQFSLDHPLGHTGYVLAEPGAEGLKCIAWLPDGAGSLAAA